MSIEYRQQGNGISKWKSPDSRFKTLPCMIWLLVPEDKIPSIVTLRPSSWIKGFPATLPSNKMLSGLVSPASLTLHMQVQVLPGPCQMIHLLRPGLETRDAPKSLDQRLQLWGANHYQTVPRVKRCLRVNGTSS